MKFVNSDEVKVQFLRRETPKSKYFHFPIIDDSTLVMLRDAKKLSNLVVTGRTQRLASKIMFTVKFSTLDVR